MSVRRTARSGLLLAAACLFTTVSVAAPPAAILSAKAGKSLLLDVARAGKRLVAVGERGHIILSDDSGRSWRQSPVPVRSLLTAVYFVDERVGWAVGHDSAILATSDGGVSWTLQHYQEYSADVPGDANLADDGEEVAEEDGMAPAPVDRTGVPLLDVWFRDAQNGLAVGAYGLLMRTRDGGKSWQDASDSVRNPEGWHFNAIAANGTGVVVIAGEKGILYRSTDAGATFAPVASPYDGSYFGAASAADGSLYVFGLQGSLYRSVDGAQKWQRLDTQVSSGLNDACALPGGGTMIAGNAGVVLTGPGVGETLRVERRADRLSVLSCVALEDGVVLVGEGGARFADLTGKNR